MSQIEQLKNFINIYRTYNEVKDKAFEINKNWRSETWTRGLRNIKEISPVKENNCIIAYKPTITPKTPQNPILSQIQTANNLDETLKDILLNMKPSWDNSNIIKEINKAIKSKHSYNKELIIRKYKSV